MKKCFKCDAVKPVDDFYKHSAMADGRLGKCKECTKVDVRTNYSGKRKQYSDYDKLRQQNPVRRAKKHQYLKNHCARNPEKYKARNAIKNAVRDGKVKRLPCQFCGSAKSQAHHTDYSKPLDVLWMCFKCHRERGHNQTVSVL